MPSVSKVQQKVMAIAEHEPGKLYKRNRGLLKMNQGQLHDFAATKRKGLPEKNGKLYDPKRTKKVNLGSAGSWTSHPGRLHRELGIPQQEKIGHKRKVAALKSSNPQTRRDARSALGYEGMK